MQERKLIFFYVFFFFLYFFFPPHLITDCTPTRSPRRVNYKRQNCIAYLPTYLPHLPTCRPTDFCPGEGIVNFTGCVTKHGTISYNIHSRLLSEGNFHIIRGIFILFSRPQIIFFRNKLTFPYPEGSYRNSYSHIKRTYTLYVYIVYTLFVRSYRK